MAIKLGVETDAQGVPLRDAEGNLIALQPGDVGYSAEKSNAAQTAIDNASEFQSQADGFICCRLAVCGWPWHFSRYLCR
jgi:hypothetical protein